MRISRVVARAAVLAALAWPAPAAADETFEFEDRRLTVGLAAQDGRLISAAKPSDGFGTTTLFEGFGSDPTPIGVLTNEPSATVDMSLGTDGRGRPVVVYSHCPGTRPCRLLRFDLATGRRRPVLASRRGCSLESPQLERGVLYFARQRERRARRGRRARCKPGIFQRRPGRPARRLTTRGHTDFDASRGVLVFTANVLDRPGIAKEILIQRIGDRRSRRRLASSRFEFGTGGGEMEDGVALDEGFVYWRRFELSRSGPDGARERSAELVRVRARGRAVKQELSAAGRNLPVDRFTGGGLPGDGFAVDGESVYYTTAVNRSVSRVTPLPPVFE